MSQKNSLDITRILKDWNNGNVEAKDLLLPIVYDELKRQARKHMSAERNGHTLQPTELVHEAFLKLSHQAGVEWKDRSHFYGIVSRLMRQILIDHARKTTAAKRGGRVSAISLSDLEIPVNGRPEVLIALNEALERLNTFDEQQAKIVEMRFFGGLSNQEIAESLNVSERTVGRGRRAAALWLCRELHQSN